METVFLIAYIVHMLAIAGILVLLLLQWNKNPRKLSGGVMHSAATALLAGLVLVGTYSSAKPDETLDHTKVGIKLVIVLVILVLSYIHSKKSELKKSIWLTLLGLTVLNILIATVG
jgi:peptidoglycan/LPS O-acetylase OafA/YrhL